MLHSILGEHDMPGPSTVLASLRTIKGTRPGALLPTSECSRGSRRPPAEGLVGVDPGSFADGDIGADLAGRADEDLVASGETERDLGEGAEHHLAPDAVSGQHRLVAHHVVAEDRHPRADDRPLAHLEQGQVHQVDVARDVGGRVHTRAHQPEVEGAQAVEIAEAVFDQTVIDEALQRQPHPRR